MSGPPPLSAAPLTLDNLASISRASFDEGSRPSNFYTLKRPTTTAAGFGYDSDNSDVSGSSAQSEMVVDFVFDSDDSGSESDASSENDEVAALTDQIAPRMSPASPLHFRLSVPRWEHLEAEEGDVGFTIAVESTQSAALSWSVLRTFAQFHEWRSGMAHSHAHLMRAIEAPFPQIEYAADAAARSSERIEARRASLSIYLAEVASHHILARSPLLLSFLHPDAAPGVEGSSRGVTEFMAAHSNPPPWTAQGSGREVHSVRSLLADSDAHASARDDDQDSPSRNISFDSQRGGGDSSDEDDNTWTGVDSVDEADGRRPPVSAVWRGNPAFLASVVSAAKPTTPSSSRDVSAANDSPNTDRPGEDSQVTFDVQPPAASASPSLRLRQSLEKRMSNLSRLAAGGAASPQLPQNVSNDYEGCSSESDPDSAHASHDSHDDLTAPTSSLISGEREERGRGDGSISPLLRGYGRYGSGYGSGTGTGILASLSIALTHVLSATASATSLSLHSRFGCFKLSHTSAQVLPSSILFIDGLEMELERGVFFASQVWKWPTRVQNSWGRMTKRLLVVRGTDLAYYNNKAELGIDGETPVTVDSAGGAYSGPLDANGRKLVQAAQVKRPTGLVIEARPRAQEAGGPADVPSFSRAEAMYHLSLSEGCAAGRAKRYWKDCLEIKAAADTLWFRVPNPGVSWGTDGATSSAAGVAHEAALLAAASEGPPSFAQHAPATSTATTTSSSTSARGRSSTTSASISAPRARAPSPPVVCATASLPQESSTPAIEARWLRELSRSIAQGRKAQWEGAGNGGPAVNDLGKKRLRLAWYHQDPTAYVVCADAVCTSLNSSGGSHLSAVLIASLEGGSSVFCLDLRASSLTRSSSPSPSPSSSSSSLSALSGPQSPSVGRRLRLSAVLADGPRARQAVVLGSLKVMPLSYDGAKEVVVLCGGLDGSVGLISATLEENGSEPINRPRMVRMFSDHHGGANAEFPSCALAVHPEAAFVCAVHMSAAGPVLSAWRSDVTPRSNGAAPAVDLQPMGTHALPAASPPLAPSASPAGERVHSLALTRFPLDDPGLWCLVLGTSRRLVLVVIDPMAASGAWFKGHRVLESSDDAMYALVLPRTGSSSSGAMGTYASPSSTSYGTTVLWVVRTSATDPLASVCSTPSSPSTGEVFSVVHREEWGRERLRAAASAIIRKSER